LLMVDIPKILNRITMYDFINQVIDEDMQPRACELCINFSGLVFIEPAGVTILSNVTEWLFKRDVKVFYNYPKIPELNRAFCFLDDSQFFQRYVGKSARKFASVRDTTIPLELVAYSDSYQWLERTKSWFAKKLNVPARSLSTINVCFQEIFNNINDHSQENIGCVFAQHFPNKNEIQVAISDFGVGIPHNIQRVNPWLNDAEAIGKAIEVGFSTKSTPNNRGAGLDTLIHNVVINNHGSVYIHSNNGILNCNYNAVDGLSIQPVIAYGFYPGTLIQINFRTDQILNILDEEEEFEW